MSIREFSASAEAFENKKSLKKEVNFLRDDVAIFKKIKDDSEKALLNASRILQEKYGDLYNAYVELKKDNPSGAENFLINESKKDDTLEPIVAAILLRGHVQNLPEAITSYVSLVHSSEGFRSDTVGDRDQQIMSDIENMEKIRSAAHNELILELKIIIRLLNNAGIDTPWSSVLGFIEGQVYRDKIQRWAQNVSDYFVSLSQTTLDSKKEVN